MKKEFEFNGKKMKIVEDEEFNLSEKKCLYSVFGGENLDEEIRKDLAIPVEDVKEFIQRLEEELIEDFEIIITKNKNDLYRKIKHKLKFKLHKLAGEDMI